MKPASLSVVLFRRKGWGSDLYHDWTYHNPREDLALVTPTRWRSDEKGYETISRFCFINPETTEEDIDIILNSMK